MNQICFLLTKDGFRVDHMAAALDAEGMRWKEAFRGAPYESLYALAFRERPTCFDAAGSFLCRVAERFTSALCAVPGLERSREKPDVAPSEDSRELLLQAVPFAIGSEYVNEAWLNRQYRRLRDVFRAEIARYDGAVALYFAEKTQKLRVPERIFFHLVESGDGDYPFAFLATYATQTENGIIRHSPLPDPLTE